MNTDVIAVDLHSFGEKFGGGKEQVAYNLLMGLQKIDISNNIIVFCWNHVSEKIRTLCPNFQIITYDFKKIVFHKTSVINKIFFLYITFLNRRRWYSFIKREVRDNNIQCVLFTNKELPGPEIGCKSVFITHDLKAFYKFSNENFNIRQLCISLYQKRYINNAFKWSDNVICISEFDKTLCKRTFNKCKPVRIYNPICFSSDYCYRLGSEYITAINILHPHKNPITLLHAFALIIDSIPDNMKLLFIGGFPKSSELILDEIKNLNIADRVIFTGHIANQEMNDYLSKTRVFVNTSSFEGFGMASVETMAKGIPCIVADNSAQREVTMNLCKYYSPATDYHALANVIMNELNNPSSEEQLLEISNIIRQSYDSVKISKEYWDYIMSILSSDVK